VKSVGIQPYTDRGVQRSAPAVFHIAWSIILSDSLNTERLHLSFHYRSRKGHNVDWP